MEKLLKTRLKNTVWHDNFMREHLSKPAEAAAYLNALAEEGDAKFLLKGLRRVVDAQGGVGKLAKRTGLSRTTLYKTLSEKGNPEVATLEAILGVYGIKIAFVPRS